MGNTNNKFIATLAISNILGFIVIFALLWMLWNNNGVHFGPGLGNNEKTTVSYVAPEPLPTSAPTTQKTEFTKPIKTPKPSVNATDISIITAVAKEVKSNYPDASGRTDKKTVQAQQDIGTNKSLSDNEYIASYDQLQSGSAMAKVEVSESDATTVKITKNTTDKNSTATNHFNKVDVSHIRSNPADKMTLAQRVAAFSTIATIEPSSGGRKADNKEAWKDYLHSLQEAAVERQNEMRTITVQNGETLWKISTRAYGTGFLYNKIFLANPHLTSPDSITVGETLRVPI